MKPTVYLLAYALLLLIGGAIGFLTKGSLGSITAGTVASILMALTALKINQGSKMAIWLAVLQAAVLTLFFGYRFLVTGLFMPGGLMALCSIALLVYMWSAFCPKSCNHSKSCKHEVR